MKQDKRKGILGMVIIGVMLIVALIVSLKASKNAASNFEMRKQEAQE